MNGPKFITDMGRRIAMADVNTGAITTLSRYAVWAHTGRKHEVIEVGNDIDDLMKRHNIPPARVVPVRRPLYPSAED